MEICSSMLHHFGTEPPPQDLYFSGTYSLTMPCHDHWYSFPWDGPVIGAVREGRGGGSARRGTTGLNWTEIKTSRGATRLWVPVQFGPRAPYFLRKRTARPLENCTSDHDMCTVHRPPLVFLTLGKTGTQSKSRSTANPLGCKGLPSHHPTSLAKRRPTARWFNRL